MMKNVITGGFCSAVVLASGMAVFAQTTQPPAPPTAGSAPSAAQQPAPPADAQQVTVAGCVQREADYRQAKDAGKGGAANTGVGAGNEFVLIAARPAGAAGSRPSETVGTSGAAGDAFELTGSGEGQLEQYVGKRVEITGKPKAMAPGGTAPNAPAQAAEDAVGKDLKLREFEVISVRAAAGECPPISR
jgi:hypothetical protein